MANLIINHPAPCSTTTYNQQYRGGTINTLARQTSHKLININSCIREEQVPSLWPDCCPDAPPCSPDIPCNVCNRCCFLRQWNSTNFNVYLPETLDKVVRLTLSALEIPNTIYSISHINETNVFQINSLDNSGCCPTPPCPLENHIIEIPAGNYEISELVTVINNTIDACNICCIKAGYDKISGRFFFYTSDIDCSGNCCYELDFSLPNNDRNIKLNLGWMLGFRKRKYCCELYIEKHMVWSEPGSDINWPCKTYFDCSNTTLNDISNNLWPDGSLPYGYISEGIVDISGPRYLFLLVNDYNNNVTSKYINLTEGRASMSASNILARISMPYGKNEIGYDDTSDLIPKTREYFGPVTIEKLHIQIVDDLGRIVDLNNNDISLLLDFEYLYNL